MLDQVLQLFAIRPDYDLDVMQPNQSLSRLTASLLTALDQVAEKLAARIGSWPKATPPRWPSPR